MSKQGPSSITHTVAWPVPAHCCWLTRPLKCFLWQLWDRKSSPFSQLSDSLAHLKHGFSCLLKVPKPAALDLVCTKAMRTSNFLSHPVQVLICFLLAPKTALTDWCPNRHEDQMSIMWKIILQLVRVWYKACYRETAASPSLTRHCCWLSSVLSHVRRPVFPHHCLKENPVFASLKYDHRSSWHMVLQDWGDSLSSDILYSTSHHWPRYFSPAFTLEPRSCLWMYMNA